MEEIKNAIYEASEELNMTRPDLIILLYNIQTVIQKGYGHQAKICSSRVKLAEFLEQKNTTRIIDIVNKRTKKRSLVKGTSVRMFSISMDCMLATMHERFTRCGVEPSCKTEEIY